MAYLKVTSSVTKRYPGGTTHTHTHTHRGRHPDGVSVSCLDYGFGDQEIVVRSQIKTRDFSLLRSVQLGLHTEQPRVLRARAYDDNSSPSSTEFMIGWIYTSHQLIRLHDVNWDNVIAIQHIDYKNNLTSSQRSIPDSSNIHFSTTFLPSVRYSTWFPYHNCIHFSYPALRAVCSEK